MLDLGEVIAKKWMVIFWQGVDLVTYFFHLFCFPDSDNHLATICL